MWLAYGVLPSSHGWWPGCSSSLLVPMPVTGCLFFDWREATSPAQRIKKEPSRRPRPPAGTPEVAAMAASAFLTRRSVPCWFLHTIENRTPSPGGTQEETVMTTAFTHENVVKLAGILGTAPELRLTANGNAVTTLI